MTLIIFGFTLSQHLIIDFSNDHCPLLSSVHDHTILDLIILFDSTKGMAVFVDLCVCHSGK